MKIVLSAFACEPGCGSEDGVGWGTAWSLAQQHEVHILTRPQHREGIERYLRLNPCHQLSVSYHDFSPTLRRWIRTSALWQIYYHAWQNRIAHWAREVVERFDPQVVHHITYGRYWTPCSLWQLGRPFVWGPLGGGDACPPTLLSCLSARERMQAGVRWLMQAIARLDPKLRATARHATITVASTPATARCLSRLGCTRVEPLLQMAVDPQLIEQSQNAPSGQPITFCSVGRLLGWKGHAFTLHAFARAAIPGARLLIVGDGPGRERLAKLAQSLGIAPATTLTGAIPRDEALRWIERSTALIHSSFHDQAPTVVFEAMAAGKPVVALALGGVSHQVTAETGFLVSTTSATQAVDDMAAALRRLSDEPELGPRLGRAGRERVRKHFTWDRKAEEFVRLYGEAIKRARAPAQTSTAISPTFGGALRAINSDTRSGFTSPETR